MNRTATRREFLEQLGISAAGIAAAGYTATARGYAANETINIACIGTGGRCRQLMKAMPQISGLRVIAVCDVWDQNLAEGKKLADPQATTTKDYRELLDRKDIDAVLIATPDHLHVPITIDACRAGKDVYVEKPLTHDLSEGQPVVDAQNNYKRVVQVGTQQRSMPQFIKGQEIVASGALGEIHKVHLTWNRNQARHKIAKLNIDPQTVDWQKFLGPAPQQPFNEYRFRNWRWFWDFGNGILTDLMVHQIDIANWFLGLEYPAMATTIGDQFTASGVWECPDTVQTLMRYPDKQVQVYFEGTFCNARNRAMIEVMGSEQTLYLDRGRYELHPEPNSKLKPTEMVIGSGGRGLDFYDQPYGELLHLSNWLECVRSRQRPRSPAESGVTAAAAAHLGNKAFRSGQVAHWNA
ncbi:MAG TPA: Gfo/Idh/MocA family oxidoreductase [Pirellulales bacterium]|jgi:predicted dehydrogenase|nr:Gfo/Idh/MocA family oxidoreductase [Pirellulales bacterium]